MSKVSVWLTSYNHGQFIEESIKSILAQTYEDYKLYIVDDCSSDNSWEIIQKYASVDKRIKAIRHDYNYGNSGMLDMLDELDGEYLAIAHCDDMWLPEKLEKQLEILEKNREITACFTLVEVIDSDGNCLSDEKHPYCRIFEQENRTRYEWLNHFFNRGNCLCHPSMLIRKNAYTEYNLKTKGLNGLPDFCKWIRLCKKTDIYIIQERLTRFRVHNDGSNTSGENVGSICRLNTEEWLVLKEFDELINAKEVTKVFPEAKKYIVNGEICEKYALAQIMLEHPRQSYKLYGLQLLYDLFQEQEQEIFRLYGYTRKSYNADKQKYDIFNVICENRFMHMSIYLECQGGYSEENKIVSEIFVQQTGAFCISVDLRKDSKEQPKRIRIDLDEGRYRKFKICKCLLDGEQIEMIPKNGTKQNEWDLFYTIDPQYEIQLQQSGCLYIEAYTEEILCAEVEQYFADIQKQCDALEKEIKRMSNTKIWKLGNAIKHLLGRT